MEQLIAGFIRGPHGIAGIFKIESASGEYDHLAELTEVTLRHGDDGEQKHCKVESAEVGTNTLFMKIAGVDTPEDARKLTGWQIIVPRDKACPLHKDQWYVEDIRNCALIYVQPQNQNKHGLAAETAPAGETVGTITDVLEGGQGDLLEVSLSEGCTLLADDVKKTAEGKLRTVLVPFNRDFIGDVDIKHKTVQLMHLWILE